MLALLGGEAEAEVLRVQQIDPSTPKTNKKKDDRVHIYCRDRLRRRRVKHGGAVCLAARGPMGALRFGSGTKNAINGWC